MGSRRKGISVAARKINRICWGKICSNKEFGGLGMKKIIKSNMEMLRKWRRNMGMRVGVLGGEV